MPFTYSRRRFLALAAGVAALARPAAAQMAPAPPQQPPGTAIRDLGTWHIVTRALNARAWLLDSAVSVVSFFVKNGNFVDGGRAELVIEYWGGEGPRSGFFPVLTLTVLGAGLATQKPARLVVDGKEIGKYDVDRELKLDLKQVFPDLAGLQQAKLVQVFMPVEGKEVLVYEARPTDTANVMATMRQAPDAFYRSQPRPPPGSASKPGDCFITTACCEVIGLRDDCFELRVLRRFRDTVMAMTPDGRADIRTYYQLAPRIVTEMRRRGEERRLLLEYVRAILPAAIAARLGLVEMPNRLYRAMMNRLMARYAAAAGHGAGSAA